MTNKITYEPEQIEAKRTYLSIGELLGQNDKGTNFIFSNNVPHDDDLSEIVRQCDNNGFVGGEYRATNLTPQIKTVVYFDKTGGSEIKVSWEEFVKLNRPSIIAKKLTLERVA